MVRIVIDEFLLIELLYLNKKRINNDFINCTTNNISVYLYRASGHLTTFKSKIKVPYFSFLGIYG